jgi:hypothetical protein
MRRPGLIGKSAAPKSVALMTVEFSLSSKPKLSEMPDSIVLAST